MIVSLRMLAVAALPLAVLSACSDRTESPLAPEAAGSRAYTAPAVPVDGELVRLSGTVYLAYGQTLYGVPDMQTFRACSGGHDKAVRDVSSLPAWPMRTLPSAGSPTTLPHGRAWMFGDRPVRGGNGTVWLVVGCVKTGIPDANTYLTIFNGDWSRILDVPDADLNALPTTAAVATALPLRRAGALVEYGGTVRWTRFRGGSLGIDSSTVMSSYCRGWGELVSGATEYNANPQTGLLNPNSSGCTRGDDYPWKTQTGSTPYAYPYRQCTSFAAFRLNQDGIEFHNMYLGRHFSDAHTWDDTAAAVGLSVTTSPRKGDIAVWDPYVGGASYAGHVAYVAGVNLNGTIRIEDYNWHPGAYRDTTVSTTGLKFIHFHP